MDPRWNKRSFQYMNNYFWVALDLSVYIDTHHQNYSELIELILLFLTHTPTPKKVPINGHYYVMPIKPCNFWEISFEVQYL